jgi:hypothetical protein
MVAATPSHKTVAPSFIFRRSVLGSAIMGSDLERALGQEGTRGTMIRSTEVFGASRDKQFSFVHCSFLFTL